MVFLFIKCSYFKIFCKIALLVALQLTPSFCTLVEFGKQVIPHALCNVLVVSEGGFLFGVAQSLFGNDGGNVMLCKPTGVSMSEVMIFKGDGQFLATDPTQKLLTIRSK